MANALPQALVLTAIVIGFGLFAFALVLVSRAYAAMGTLDGDLMRVAEPEADTGHEGGHAFGRGRSGADRAPSPAMVRPGGPAPGGEGPARAPDGSRA